MCIKPQITQLKEGCEFGFADSLPNLRNNLQSFDTTNKQMI